MTKGELKTLIKEMIKETIFEDGFLSKIVKEVAMGLSDGEIITEERIVAPKQQDKRIDPDILKRKIREKVSGKDENPYSFLPRELTENIIGEPIQDDVSAVSNPLARFSSNDSGTNISFMEENVDIWKKLAFSKKEKNKREE